VRDKLEKYVTGETKFTPMMNILMNNRDRDWYSELGKHITIKIDISRDPRLSLFKLPKENVATKIKSYLKNDNTYTSIAIIFLTSNLDASALKKIFGDPIYHSEFGEGFEGEYDEETDDYGKPEIEDLYASYFVTINGIDLHIGFDHRGTSIEVGSPILDNRGRNTFTHVFTIGEAESVFNALKEIVNLYAERV
jgi:hypothetical protein